MLKLPINKSLNGAIRDLLAYSSAKSINPNELEITLLDSDQNSQKIQIKVKENAITVSPDSKPLTREYTKVSLGSFFAAHGDLKDYFFNLTDPVGSFNKYFDYEMINEHFTMSATQAEGDEINVRKLTATETNPLFYGSVNVFVKVNIKDIVPIGTLIGDFIITPR